MFQHNRAILSLLLLVYLVETCVTHVHYPRPQLPDKVIVGYANWNECDSKVVDSVVDGVNVVIWFAINLAVDSNTGLPTVTGGPDMDCVADKVAEIRALNLENDTIHLISIGGWDAPHPDTSNNASLVYAQWDHWNRHIAARPERNFYGFDGFDWDIEGNDDPASQYNVFTVECLNLMGHFSQLAHWMGGYIVSMAPAESYLDPSRAPLFSRTLLHEYAEWQVGPSALDPPFRYHGLNVYSYLLARFDRLMPETWVGVGDGRTSCGRSTVIDPSRLETLLALQRSVRDIERSGLFSNNYTPSSNGSDYGSAGNAGDAWIMDPVPIDPDHIDGHTFSFITVQLYEGYSHAEFNTTRLHPPQPVEDYVAAFVLSMGRGFTIDFSTDAELKYPVQHEVCVHPSRLVVGLANGWAGDGKFPLFYPNQVGRGYAQLRSESVDSTPRGFAFWDIADEGKASPQRPEEQVWMAAGLNRFMNIRRQTKTEE